MVEINLPYPPSVNNLYVNVRGRGRVPSERYTSWRNVAGWDLKSQKPKRVRGPVSIQMQFEERPGRHDLGNLEKAATDLLVEHRIIDGDDSKIVREIWLAWNSNVKGCRVVIKSLEAA